MNESTWYRDGLVTLTNGSDLVDGVGTQFIDNVLIGGIFFTPTGLVEVSRVVSDTRLQLVQPYGGPTAAGVEYAVAPTQGAVVAATKQLQAFLVTLGPLKQAWEAGDLNPKGLALKGVKETFEDLPASGNATGDGWIVDQVLYVWTGTAWYNAGAIGVTAELQALRDDAVEARATTVEIAEQVGDLSVAVDIAVASAEATAADRAAVAITAAQALAATNARPSVSVALADGTLAIGASFTAPLADGSFQAYIKTSTTVATPFGSPFASQAAIDALGIRLSFSAPGFALSFINAIYDVAGGIRENGALEFDAGAFRDLVTATLAATRMSIGTGAIDSALSVPGFVTAWTDAVFGVAGGVRDDGTLDFEAAVLRSATIAALTSPALTASAATITTLNGTPVSQILAGIQQQTDFVPALARSSLRYPLIAATTRLSAGPATGAGGWAVSGGTLAVESVNVRQAGRNVLKVNATTPAGAGAYVVIRKKVPLRVINGKFEIGAFIPGGAITSIGLYYSSDVPANDPPTSTAANRRLFQWAPDQIKTGGWQSLTADIGAATGWTNTGAPNAARVAQVEIFVSISASVPDGDRYALIDTVGFGGRAIPFVMLTFDGGYESHITKALPMLQARGFVGTQFSDGELIEGNRAFLDLLYQSGWDLGHQGRYHTNYLNNPANFSEDVDAGKAALIAAGYTTLLDGFAFPQSSDSAALRATLRSKGYKFARASYRPLTPFSSEGREELVSCGSRDTGQKSAEIMKAWLDQAVSLGESMVVHTHGLVPTAPVSALETLDTAYESFLDYAKQKESLGLCRIVNISQALRAWGIN